MRRIGAAFSERGQNAAITSPETMWYRRALAHHARMEGDCAVRQRALQREAASLHITPEWRATAPSCSGMSDAGSTCTSRPNGGRLRLLRHVPGFASPSCTSRPNEGRLRPLPLLRVQPLLPCTSRPDEGRLRRIGHLYSYLHGLAHHARMKGDCATYSPTSCVHAPAHHARMKGDCAACLNRISMC